MSVLVLVEHDNHNLKAVTLNTVTAALALEADVHLLVAGYNCSEVVESAKTIQGVTTVLQADSVILEHQMAESVAPLIASLASEYSHILAAATTYGKNSLPRASALVDSQLISDILSVESADTFKRPIYAGNVIATVKSNDVIKFLTVRTTAFDAANAETGTAIVKSVTPGENQILSSFVDRQLAKSDRPELTSASIVVSGGRGLQNGENFELLFKLADELNAAVGASRAAVDAGFVPNDMQVGQTGKIVAPDLYIAIGISGAIQHLAGMKESKVIVAINKDEGAPIFQIADYGLVADLFDVLPELTDKLTA
ncbi:electron transfer flavoprotein subunit alpha/FixB family protein [Teredinibacter haidensis]|uniref:electron transfer flavoprotein subunit alpha/FixB family protein n=1 Tax=Teredinibacter haidensis TaxID=2731755 RepID=UPI000948BF60|nr:FAD-binding protein [Teredinibacter haidensis]